MEFPEHTGAQLWTSRRGYLRPDGGSTPQGAQRCVCVCVQVSSCIWSLEQRCSYMKPSRLSRVLPPLHARLGIRADLSKHFEPMRMRRRARGKATSLMLWGFFSAAPPPNLAFFLSQQTGRGAKQWLLFLSSESPVEGLKMTFSPSHSAAATWSEETTCTAGTGALAALFGVSGGECEKAHLEEGKKGICINN